MKNQIKLIKNETSVTVMKTKIKLNENEITVAVFHGNSNRIQRKLNETHRNCNRF